MAKNRAFSLYDIEEFLKEAGAERINERAVLSLEEELESTVKELVTEAQVYANYAGRTKLIKGADINMIKQIGKSSSGTTTVHALKTKAAKVRKRAIRINGIAFTRVQTSSL